MRTARTALAAAIAIAAIGLAVGPAAAHELSLDLGDSGALTGRIIQLIALITVLTLAPSILVVLTSFTRIVVVLSLLRSAMGSSRRRPTPY